MLIEIATYGHVYLGMKKLPKTELIAPSCDWQVKPSKAKKISSSESSHTDKSVIFKHRGNYKWKGIKTETYKSVKGDWSKIIRKVLIGNSLKTKSHVRYFEIAHGGRSSFEKHRHEHIVIGIRGDGEVLLNNRSYKIGFLDVVYVSPNTPHQFLNHFDEPFGFLCVVPAKRDKPVLINY